MTRLAASLWEDLTATRWKEHGRTPGDGLDCWGLTQEVFRRAGVELPAAPDESRGWRRLRAPETGCLVLMDLACRRHVGVYLGEDGLLHSTKEAGACVTKLSAAEAAGIVRGYFWPDGAAVPVTGAPEATGVTATWVDLITGERTVEHHEFGWEPPENPYIRVLARAPGFVVLARTPGEITFFAGPAVAGAAFFDIGLFLLGAAFSVLGALLSRPAIPKIKDRVEESTPTFDLSGYLRNTSGVGGAQPIVYGTHRVGGHILSAFQRAGLDGRSTLYMLIMVSRGPIQSIGGQTAAVDDLTGSAIPSTITIDGNPASSYNCSVSLRMGTSDQEPIPGFRESVTATAYAMTLLVGNPFTHVGSVAMQGFECVFQFPLGLYDINLSNGNVGPRTVTFTIRWKLQTSSTFTNSATFQVTNSRTGPFARTFRQDNLTKGKYDVQVERISPVWPETVGQDVESRSDLVEVHEIAYDALSYPGKALIGLRAVATDQLNGGIPQVNSVVDGRKVYIWDGVSTTTPTFTNSAETWTDNPAWCLMDLLIHPHHGMGRGGKLTLDNIDLAAFKTWADYCDTTPDLAGAPSTLKRATCDLVVDTVQGGWELANQIALSHWGRLVMVGRKVSVVTEKVTTPVYQFAMGQVSDVVISYLGRKQRPNAVEMQYFNEDTNYEADFAPRQNDTAIITNGEAVVKESMQAVGVTRPSQAYRLAQWRLNHATTSKRRIEFTSGMESIHLIPGDVIWFTHDANNIGTSGRLLSVTSSTQIKLDHDLDASSGTTKILVKLADDTLQERTVVVGTYTRNTDVTVTSAFSPVPAAGAPYAAGPSTTYRQSYRITQIDTTPDLKRRIFAAEYADSIYSDDPGVIESFTDVMPDPRTVPAAVDNLALREQGVVSADGVETNSVVVVWDTAQEWQGVDLWYQERTDDATAQTWLYAGRSWYGRYQIDNVAGGATITVSAVPVAPRGSHRGPDFGKLASLYVRGRKVKPTAPTAMEAGVTAGVLRVEVTRVTDPQVSGYQIRYGATWAGSVLIAESAGNIWSGPCPWVGGAETVRVRTVTRHGVVSTSEVTASVTHTLPEPLYTRDVNSDEHTAWGGTKTNTAVSSNELVLSASNLSGTYETPTKSPYLDGFRQTAFVRLRAGLRDTDRTWDDCGLRWGEATETWATSYLNGFEVSEGLSWDDAGFTWDSLPATCSEWAGPRDIVALLQPTIDVKDSSGNYQTFRLPVEEAWPAATLQGKVTIIRPHANYVPVLKEMNTSTAVLGGNEPERFSYGFSVSAATGVGGRTVGFVATTATNVGLQVPTGKILTVLYAQGVWLSGTSAGTYTCDVIVRNVTGAADIVLATGSTSSTSTKFYAQAEGTRVSPLGTLAAGNEFSIGWLNRGTSPAALSSANHHVVVAGIVEDA